jgi:hypothetical protein
LNSRSSVESLSNLPTVFLGAEIGVGIRYFCQTRLLRELVARGLDVVVVVPNVEEVGKLLADKHLPVGVERLRVDKLDEAFDKGRMRRVRSLVYACVNYLRVAGMSRRMNVAVTRDATALVERRWMRTGSRLIMLLPFLRVVASLLGNSRFMRRLFEWLLDHRPLDRFHTGLFEKYRPSLVVTSSAAWWPSEEGLLREAQERAIETLSVVSGWDHPTSKGLPGARPDRIAVWSELQRGELVSGSDFDRASVDICGPVHFDVYRDSIAVSSRDAYMRRHRLDPSKRLITFGCSFVALSPNFIIVKALAEALARGELGTNVQLLVRLHPSHLKKAVGKYREVHREVDDYYALAEQFPDVRIDSPLLGTEGVAHYPTPEDASRIASLFAHSDVFVTLFSTMVLEACFNDVPVVAAAFEPGSSDLEDFLPISSALDWPTHTRIISSGAASVARNSEELVTAVRRYLENPTLHARERREFARQECTFLDGQCAGRLAAVIDGIARRANPEAIRGQGRRMNPDYRTAQALAK